MNDARLWHPWLRINRVQRKTNQRSGPTRCYAFDVNDT
jgi:hypothetical protein